MVSKYGHLMLLGGFPEKRASDIDFTDLVEDLCTSCSSVWYSSYKNTFVGADNLQMITNKFWFEYLRIVSGPNLVYSLSFLGSWSM